jgi:DNA-binding GntR family transcriptional regulator
MAKTTPFVLKPTVRQTLGESIADSLREAILGGHFRPGQRLAEASIAGTLKVSRAPVREALASLEQEGLVLRSVNRGAAVICPARRDVEEICSLRLPLEVLAVREAIQNGTEEHWSVLEANIRETESARSPEALATLDLEFHDALIRAAGHRRLQAAWQSLRSQIHLLMRRRNLEDVESHRATIRSHEALLRALRRRDAAQAVELVERHHQKQYAWLIEGYDEVEAAG